MSTTLSDILFYSIVTAVLCGLLWELGGIPWQGLILIGIILIGMIIVSVVREKGRGGPKE